MGKPKGSGVFAVACGILFLLTLIASFFVDITKLDPKWIIRIWLLFVASILLSWGVNRVKKANQDSNAKKDMTVGQDTINFVVGIIGATFGLIALFAGK